MKVDKVNAINKAINNHFDNNFNGYMPNNDNSKKIGVEEKPSADMINYVNVGKDIVTLKKSMPSMRMDWQSIKTISFSRNTLLIGKDIDYKYRPYFLSVSTYSLRNNRKLDVRDNKLAFSESVGWLLTLTIPLIILTAYFVNTIIIPILLGYLSSLVVSLIPLAFLCITFIAVFSPSMFSIPLTKVKCDKIEREYLKHRSKYVTYLKYEYGYDSPEYEKHKAWFNRLSINQMRDLKIH